MNRIKTDKIFGEKNLIIYFDEGERGYEEQMIRMLNNSNILSCKLDYQDGKKRLCYNINGLLPLSRYLELNPLSLDDIKKYLIQLKHSIDLLERYMLGVENIYLGRDGIYADEETGAMKLCIVPEKKLHTSGTEFTELLLQNVNTEDVEALRFAFKIFKASLKDDFEIKNLLKLLEINVRSGTSEVKAISEDIKVPEKNDFYNKPAINSQHHEEIKNKLILSDMDTSVVEIKKTKPSVKRLRNIRENDKTGILVKIMVSISVLSVLLFIIVMLKGRAVLKRVLIPYFILSAAISIYHAAGYLIEKLKKSKYETTEDSEGDDEIMYRLIPMDMKDDIIDISYFPFIIGSGDGITDYKLHGRGIEAVHLRIEAADDGLLFTDMNTANGVQIGSLRLTGGQSQLVKNGTELMLGEHKYILQK